jgi:drug/metabolite transporter (DMT)-like permease
VHEPATNSTLQQRKAALCLILATVFWGCSFTWTKVIVDVINHRLSLPDSSPAGPAILTGVRFTLGAILWFAIFPASRRGWNARSVRDGVVLGILMAAGMLMQTTGLAQTSVAASAFLTSLTVLFVPLISILVHLKLPSPILSIGVLLATCGVYLLLRQPGSSLFSGFGMGELLGLLCAIVFSIHIMGINALLNRDNIFRVSGLMLLVVGLISLAACPFVAPRLDLGFLLEKGVPIRMAALLLICTIGAFGLQFYFQPLLNPTRAALLYLFEPVFAAVFAYFAIGERLAAVQLGGAALIIVANALVELLAAWGKKEETQKVALP